MVYKSISVVLMIAVGMMIMAAHHEKESDDLASLKEAHNLNWDSWEAADVETHFGTIHPEGSGIFDDGNLVGMQNVDYDQARNMAKQWYENFEVQIGNPNFNIQGNVAVGTYNQTTTNKETGREEKNIRTDVWARTGGKWLRFHFQYTLLTADNVVMTNRFMEEVWNEGNLSVIDEIFSPSMVQGQKQAIASVRTAFPDIQFRIDDTSAGSNKVTVEWTVSGTHQEEYMGVTATGKKAEFSGVSVVTFAGGKIVKTSVVFDSLNLWRQLGVDPPQPPAAGSSTAE